MALQFNKKRGWKIPALTGAAVVIGGTYLILKSFPHLKDHINDFITGYTELDPEEDRKLTEAREAEVQQMAKDLEEEERLKGSTSQIGGSIVDIKTSDAVDVDQWNTETLKAWLKEVRIIKPCF